jgi:SAM-dependent methyltransferase
VVAVSLHRRYLQQAAWTRDLRSYLFERVRDRSADRILEVGCGTGAVLMDIVAHPPSGKENSQLIYGIDLDDRGLTECRNNVPPAILARGDALDLPFENHAFDVSLCHFLLLWVEHPIGALREMKRVSRRHVLALAEPDYTRRIDLPPELAPLGQLQREALEAQGADVSIGSRLADLFDQAGIQIVETGPIAPLGQGKLTTADLESEWQVLETDLEGTVPESELARLRALDERAVLRGDRLLYVPTYFAWGQV